MDPISSFRTFLPPAANPGGASPLGGAGLTRGPRGPIPAAELQTLNPEFGLGAPAPATAGSSFENTLANLVHGVNDKQTAAGDAVRGLTSGQNVSLHQAMISMEEASVSFQLMVEVRNKLLESYQELMRMQI